jgi:hypothetical protein
LSELKVFAIVPEGISSEEIEAKIQNAWLHIVVFRQKSVLWRLTVTIKITARYSAEVWKHKYEIVLYPMKLSIVCILRFICRIITISPHGAYSRINPNSTGVGAMSIHQVLLSLYIIFWPIRRHIVKKIPRSKHTTPSGWKGV